MNEREIFDAALQITDLPERAAYLERVCGRDTARRDRIAELLDAQRRLGNFLESPPGELAVTIDGEVPEKPGTQIGHYKLLQQIGEGGFGVVYMAEQHRPVRRKVALKVIKPGMDTNEVIARFEAERQALAMMDHPNIAKVLDAGTTESDRPFFVMELVRGIPITDYCDRERFGTRQRLELFVNVCQAVQHAHQKGIIHRDMKPSNVLITEHDGTPVAKVIDFGVAKAINQQLTERTIFTRFQQMVGTPMYMSPEQAELSGLDVDTRADIYSLGVLLYELLTGTTPFDKQRFSEAAYDEIRRMIREEEPPKPSTRISTLGVAAGKICGYRKTDLKRLRQLMRGELDWIVMKALEKERARRYETAQGFAHDVQRYLNNETVQACPPSAGYRFRKFARRNRAMLATAGIIAAALLFGLMGTTSQWWRAESALVGEAEQRQIARREAKRAEDQRQDAEMQRNRALQAEEAAKRERDLARQQSEENRRLLYVSDMIAAQQAWDAANVSRVVKLLRRHEPRTGEEDLRRFEWYYLWRLCRRSLISPTFDHGRICGSVAFAPDGKSLFTGGLGIVKLWDVATGMELLTLDAHEVEPMNGMAISLDGKMLATGGADETLKLWQLVEGNEPAILNPPTILNAENPFWVWCLAFSTDGMLASNGPQSEVILWDVDKRSELRVLKGHEKKVRRVAFSPDGTMLASGSADSTVILWDIRSGQPLATLKGHTADVWAVAFSPDGATLASAGGTTIKLWDVATSKQRTELEGHTGGVFGVAFSPDGKTLASASKDGTVKLWDVQAEETRETLKGNSDTVHTVAFSPNGRTLASSSFDGQVKLWDLSVAIEDTPQGQRVQFSTDGETLVSWTRKGSLNLWDIATGEPKDTFKSPAGGSVAISPNGKSLATGSRDGTVKVQNLDTGVIRELLEPHDGPVDFVMFSPDGKTLASVGGTVSRDVYRVKLWDLATFQRRANLKVCQGILAYAMAFSPDGETLATAVSLSRDQTEISIRLCDLSGNELAKLDGLNYPIEALAFSADGNMLASGTFLGEVKIWDVRTGKQLLDTLTGHLTWVHSLAFSPDGRRLASSSTDGTVRLWDTWAGDEVMTLKAHSGRPLAVAFSPDGKILASGSEDDKVELWRAGTDAELRAAGW